MACVPKFYFWTDAGDQAFSGELLQAQCVHKDVVTGKQCNTRMYVGLPYCPVHLLQVKQLAIKPSVLVPGQLGLFAASNATAPGAADDTIIFRPGQRLIEYVGEDISESELHRRYGATDAYVAPYVLRIRDRYIDSACVRGAAAFANGFGRASQGANARAYVTPTNSRVDAQKFMLQATKCIRNGEEVILVYGTEYFKTDDTSHHRTEYPEPTPLIV